ncbi:hypothetical protein AUF78_12780 [archaeon 13_1_20CM_2_51_12]|nr:MAG: hypothetical protein AUF78_12780 [archaeon 13_1_20CM_2_51_12]
MFKQIDYVMIGVSDMDKSVGFYKDTLGMPLKYETSEWTEFQTGATTFSTSLVKASDHLRDPAARDGFQNINDRLHCF